MKDRCSACGLPTAAHRGKRNETLSCAKAAKRIGRAKPRALASLLALSKKGNAK